MIIKHNLSAMNANRMLGITSGKKGKIAEKLASGYRINRSADDAAGLAISEKMRRQIRGLSRASLNAQDGISLVQSAEGAMNELHEMMQRGTELAVQAANGTLTAEDRQLVDIEIQQLKDAVNGVAQTTVFNEINLFPPQGNSPQSVEAPSLHYEVKFDLNDGTFTVINYADTIQHRAGEGDGVNQALANKIANELVPNAVKQIFDAFPALRDAVGGDTIDMTLDISNIDGASGTLAYAQCSFYPTGKPINFLLKVDSSDFDDEDALGTGSNAEMLESTLAHELMHSVMYYTLPDGMTGRTGQAFPDWFVEGTAQLSGGGYTTGWNDALTYYTSGLTDENDTSQDAQIKDYLDNYSVAGRPYGHGYLAAAYAGYLAGGGVGDITPSGIANGMNLIFADMLGGKSFDQALMDRTGLTNQSIENMFATGDTQIVDFVRKLSYKTGQGAGSVLNSSFNVGGTDILGNSAVVQQFTVTNIQGDVGTGGSGGTGGGGGGGTGGGGGGGTGGGGGGGGTGGSGGSSITLQVGMESTSTITVKLYQMSVAALGLTATNTQSEADARNAIGEFKNAIKYISNVRTYYGGIQNRLEHTIANLDNVVENTTAAEAVIRDTDMAKLMVEFSNTEILQQAGQAILAQANQQPEYILKLLG